MENSTTLGIDNNKDRPSQFSPKQSRRLKSTYCSVCGKGSKDYRELIFHELPKQKSMIKTQDGDGNIVMKNRRQVWYKKTLISTNLKHPLVCSSHFRHSDYIAPDVQGKTKRFLKRNAVPTLDLPSPGSSLNQHRNRKRLEDEIARQKKRDASYVQEQFLLQNERKSVTEEKKSSVEVIQKIIILQPIIYNTILFAPIYFDEFWCNAHTIILPNERWSFCKLETTECGKELVFSEIMYDGKSKMRSTKKQVVLSCQNGFQYFIHSEELTSKQISTRINENVSTVELLQSLLCEVDNAEVSNGVIKLSTTSSPHHSSYQEVEEITIDPLADTNQEQCNKWPLKRKKSQKIINLDPIADSKQLQCKNPIVYGNKVLLNMKNSKIEQLSLKPKEIQDSRNDHSRVLPIESVFIKEESCLNETIDSEQFMFIKEESCDIHENENLTFPSADDLCVKNSGIDML